MTANRRRWLWPALVLIVGGSMTFWFAQGETKRMAAIERQVHDICRAVAEHRDVTGTLNRSNPAVERRVVQALTQVIDSPDTAAIVQVKVKPGDNDQAGPSAIRATHTATIMIGETELLGLRVQCSDAEKPITVLGYWTPETH